MTNKTEGMEVVGERIVNAPRALVWAAWADPERLRHWWLPKGFANPFHKHETERRGIWRFFGKKPEKAEAEIIQVEVEKPSRIVLDHGSTPAFYAATATVEDRGDHSKITLHSGTGSAEMQGAAPRLACVEIEKPSRIFFDHSSAPGFRSTAVLEDFGSRTKITFHAAFRSVGEYEVVRNLAPLGMEQNFNDIEIALAQLTSLAPPRIVTLERRFHAHHELVWKFWTDPAHLAKWWGSKGSSTTYAAMDLRRGGAYHYCVVAPGGFESWGKLHYRDVVKPARLLWVNAFSDRMGGMIRHPVVPYWPLEILCLAAFEDKGADDTLITLQWWPINAFPAEVQLFNDQPENLKRGWSEAFDRLAEALRNQREGRWTPKPFQG